MNEYNAIVRTLVPVIAEGASLDASWDPTASPLAKEITYGVLRDWYRLNAVVNALVTKPLSEKHLDVQILLLAGLYSVDHLKRPDYTSVNAVVGETANISKPWAKGLVNGVLRNYLRKRDQINSTAAEDPLARTNHPAWLADAIKGAWPYQANSIFKANNQHAPMVLRVNVQKASRQAYMATLREHGFACNEGTLSDTSIYLEEPVDTSRIPGFAEGFASVQDEASQLVAPLLNAVPRLRILDACAAPGGKTCHILETTPDALVTAVEIDPDRARLVRQNLKRVGASANVVVADLRSYQSGNQFDRILLDVPCSATGIIRRHPDIKLLRRKTDIDKLAQTQLELIEAAWQLLAPEGVLVYSTCSILPAENESVISHFLANSTDAVSNPITTDWGIATTHGRQLLPTLDGHDGFFYARLVKHP